MGRDDLYITVPSHFKCPISLDVMKSPVSLSTGVTYDRESIQRWLDGGNNTCPATMQVLPSKDFVPNRTLQRLIQTWSDHHLHPSSTQPGSLYNSARISSLIQSLRPATEYQYTLDCLRKILSFSEESDENRDFLSRSDGFVSMLVEYFHDRVDVKLLDAAIQILSVLLVKLKEQQNSISRLVLRKKC